MRPANIIVLASTNSHKFAEFQTLFKSFPQVHVAPAQDYLRNASKLALVENSDHYYQNALAKARACNHGCHYPSLSDDSGIEVEALGGRPGVKSHRYAIPRAGETQDEANIKKLLGELSAVGPGKRQARFVCHLALVMEGKLIHTVGALDGQIATEPRGNHGFGYDPIFIPNGETKTLSELGPEFKLKNSHRTLALQAMFEEIERQEIILAKP